MTLRILSECDHEDDGTGFCNHCGKWCRGWDDEEEEEDDE